MDDGLWEARRAAGVEDVQRVRGRELLEHEIAGRGTAKERVIVDSLDAMRLEVGEPQLALDVVDDNDSLQPGLAQLGHDLGSLGGAGPLLAIVHGAVVGEEHLGGNLAEAIEHGGDAIVGADPGPDGADRGRAEHGNESLDMVGDVAGNDVVRAQAGGTEGIGAAADCLAELIPRRGPQVAGQLGGGDDGGRGWVDGRRRGREEQVLGEVEAGRGEEVGAGEHGRIVGEGLDG